MLKRFVVAFMSVGLIVLGSLSGGQSPFVFAQQPIVGHLSAEQRSAIQLLVSSHSTPADFFTRGPVIVQSNFKPGEPVYIGLVMTNTRPEPARVCAFSNPFYQNRPQLTRDGRLVAYSEHINELVRQSDEGTLCEFTRTPDIVDLKTNVPFHVPIIDLREWYGPLSSGHYTLFLKHTFACCADGLWNSTNVISFDVTL
jgi:hypothetical protein